jgi:hypothetical protein
MGRLIVLDPTAAPADEDLGPGPDAQELRGKVLGIRTDRVWRSFEWVIDEWSPRLAELGADVRLWVVGNRIGEEGERTRRELEGFARDVDVAIVGLGN